LQPKLSPAVPEARSLTPGKAWTPVKERLPEQIVGPWRADLPGLPLPGGHQHQTLVAGGLEECRFLAVPSYTPHYTAKEFTAQAIIDSRRYKTPVLWADAAHGGGSSIHVDEGHPGDLRLFPEHAGYLEAGDEGVIAARVNLGYVRPGDSTPYDASQKRPIEPFAAASLVYRSTQRGDQYAAWLEAEAGPLLARDDPEARMRSRAWWKRPEC